MLASERSVTETVSPSLDHPTSGSIISPCLTAKMDSSTQSKAPLQSPSQTLISLITTTYVNCIIKLLITYSLIFQKSPFILTIFINIQVMLFGASDSYQGDSIMQVTVAFNHFGKGLVQRMPRCRWGFFHVVNNDYTHWLMYAIGGSQHPTIISQGNRFIAPPNPAARQVKTCIVILSNTLLVDQLMTNVLLYYNERADYQ